MNFKLKDDKQVTGSVSEEDIEFVCGENYIYEKVEGGWMFSEKEGDELIRQEFFNQLPFVIFIPSNYE